MKIRLWRKHKQKDEGFSNESFAKEAKLLQRKTNEFENLNAICKYVSKCSLEKKLISDETPEKETDKESNEYVKAFNEDVERLLKEFENGEPMHFY